QRIVGRVPKHELAHTGAHRAQQELGRLVIADENERSTRLRTQSLLDRGELRLSRTDQLRDGDIDLAALDRCGELPRPSCLLRDLYWFARGGQRCGQLRERLLVRGDEKNPERHRFAATATAA